MFTWSSWYSVLLVRQNGSKGAARQNSFNYIFWTAAGILKWRSLSCLSLHSVDPKSGERPLALAPCAIGLLPSGITTSTITNTTTWPDTCMCYIFIPDIGQFWGTTALFSPVKV